MDLTAAQRRKAEQALARCNRDRQERGRLGFRAAAQSLAPDLLMDEDDEEDEEDELLTGMRRRTRHQYDERIEDDDDVQVAGIEKSSNKNHHWHGSKG